MTMIMSAITTMRTAPVRPAQRGRADIIMGMGTAMATTMPATPITRITRIMPIWAPPIRAAGWPLLLS